MFQTESSHHEPLIQAFGNNHKILSQDLKMALGLQEKNGLEWGRTLSTLVSKKMLVKQQAYFAKNSKPAYYYSLHPSVTNNNHLHILKHQFQMFDSFMKTLDLDSLRNKYGAYKALEGVDFDKREKTQFLMSMDCYVQGNAMEFEDFCDNFIYSHKNSLIKKIATHYAPENEADYTNMVNQLKQPNSMMAFIWTHMRGRIYRMWASVLTEKHATMGLKVATANDTSIHIIDDVTLDSMGVDFVIVKNKIAYPCQIKKDSHTKIARGKGNGKDNFSIVEMSEKNKDNLLTFMRAEHSNIQIDAVQNTSIVKYSVISKDALIYKIDTKTAMRGDEKPEYKKFKQELPYLTLETNGMITFEADAFLSLLKKQILSA